MASSANPAFGPHRIAGVRVAIIGWFLLDSLAGWLGSQFGVGALAGSLSSHDVGMARGDAVLPTPALYLGRWFSHRDWVPLAGFARTSHPTFMDIRR